MTFKQWWEQCGLQITEVLGNKPELMMWLKIAYLEGLCHTEEVVESAICKLRTEFEKDSKLLKEKE